MLNFRMDMPFYLMAFYGSIMILVVCLLRYFLKDHLLKFVFPMLWVLVLVRFIVPFSISSPISAPVPEWQPTSTEVYITENVSKGKGGVIRNSDTEVEYVSETIEASSYPVISANWSMMDRNIDWISLIPIIFCLGAIATTSLLLYQRLGYSKKLKSSLLIEHNETINTIIREIGMGHILVFTNDQIASPLVCGVLNPCIYLPTNMDFQNEELLRHILAHETMHVKRRDNWIKYAMLIVICMNWYNPLVWLMSKYLCSDLETACDAAVLNQIDISQRQNYAFSLLAMAITGNRSTLLYSAFSKIEVERRIKNVLAYKKATAFTMALSVILLFCGTVAFASGGQAPFSSYLSSYCVSSSCKWGVSVALDRDIALGENPRKRADDTILSILSTDNTSDPTIIESNVQKALAKEFGVEKGALKLEVNLSLDKEELEKEYALQGITKKDDGFYLYKGEVVRCYTDEMLSAVQQVVDGVVDIEVVRDRLANIISVTALRKGDSAFDKRTREIEVRQYYNYDIPYNYNETIVTDTGATIEQVTQGVIGNSATYARSSR